MTQNLKDDTLKRQKCLECKTPDNDAWHSTLGGSNAAGEVLLPFYNSDRKNDMEELAAATDL